jgi:hypothetical protein
VAACLVVDTYISNSLPPHLIKPCIRQSAAFWDVQLAGYLLPPPPSLVGAAPAHLLLLLLLLLHVKATALLWLLSGLAYPSHSQQPA